jgi:XTP/dITP diphosphohydrolase
VSPVRLLLATRNAKKLDELRRILVSSGASPHSLVGRVRVLGIDDVPPFPEVPETAATFEANALAKARGAAAATGLPAVADDSGLAVDALNGMPGVLSARWAGRHGDDAANLQLVLDQLADVPADRRGAAFVCAAALVVPLGAQVSGTQTVVRAEWRGTLTRAPRGCNGFGYDPIFVPDGERCTSAELDPAEKDVASHRGQALRALLPALRHYLSGQFPLSG